MSSTSLSSGFDCYNNLTSYYNNNNNKSQAYSSCLYPDSTFDQPCVYYAKILQTRERKHRNQSKRNSAEGDALEDPDCTTTQPTPLLTPLGSQSKQSSGNCFIKAYRWFTYQDSKTKARVGVDTFQRYHEPYEAQFARWLDAKYQEFLSESRRLSLTGERNWSQNLTDEARRNNESQKSVASKNPSSCHQPVEEVPGATKERSHHQHDEEIPCADNSRRNVTLYDEYTEDIPFEEGNAEEGFSTYKEFAADLPPVKSFFRKRPSKKSLKKKHSTSSLKKKLSKSSSKKKLYKSPLIKELAKSHKKEERLLSKQLAKDVGAEKKAAKKKHSKSSIKKERSMQFSGNVAAHNHSIRKEPSKSSLKKKVSKSSLKKELSKSSLKKKLSKSSLKKERSCSKQFTKEVPAHKHSVRKEASKSSLKKKISKSSIKKELSKSSLKKNPSKSSLKKERSCSKQSAKDVPSGKGSTRKELPKSSGGKKRSYQCGRDPCGESSRSRGTFYDGYTGGIPCEECSGRNEQSSCNECADRAPCGECYGRNGQSSNNQYSEGLSTCGCPKICGSKSDRTIPSTEPTISKRTMIKSLSETHNLPAYERIDNTHNEGTRPESVVRLMEPNENPSKHSTRSKTSLHMVCAKKKKKHKEKHKPVPICLCCECSLQTQAKKLRGRGKITDIYCPNTTNVEPCACACFCLDKSEGKKGPDMMKDAPPPVEEEVTNHYPVTSVAQGTSDLRLKEVKDASTQTEENKMHPMYSTSGLSVDPMIVDNFATLTKTNKDYALFVNGDVQTSKHSIKFDNPVLFQIISADNRAVRMS